MEVPSRQEQKVSIEEEADTERQQEHYVGQEENSRWK